MQTTGHIVAEQDTPRNNPEDGTEADPFSDRTYAAVKKSTMLDRADPIHAIDHHEIHSGPLPRPSDLAGYEAILPGAAERLMRMSELQFSHDAELEKLIVLAQIEDQKRGMHYGLVALLVLIAAAVYFGLAGNTVVAGLFLTAGVIGIIPAFILGRARQT